MNRQIFSNPAGQWNMKFFTHCSNYLTCYFFPLRMPLSIEIIQVLLFVIRFFANNDEDIRHTLDEVLVNGEVNRNALRRLEELLIEKEMRDVLQLMRETMRGKMRRSL